jgi:hypothetical protein
LVTPLTVKLVRKTVDVLEDALLDRDGAAEELLVGQPEAEVVEVRGQVESARTVDAGVHVAAVEGDEVDVVENEAAKSAESFLKKKTKIQSLDPIL